MAKFWSWHLRSRKFYDFIVLTQPLPEMRILDITIPCLISFLCLVLWQLICKRQPGNYLQSKSITSVMTGDRGVCIWLIMEIDFIMFSERLQPNLLETAIYLIYFIVNSFSNQLQTFRLCSRHKIKKIIKQNFVLVL